jgi:hypothetical protein
MPSAIRTTVRCLCTLATGKPDPRCIFCRDRDGQPAGELELDPAHEGCDVCGGIGRIGDAPCWRGARRKTA